MKKNLISCLVVVVTFVLGAILAACSSEEDVTENEAACANKQCCDIFGHCWVEGSPAPAPGPGYPNPGPAPKP
jgi:hypothetical protein